MLKEQKSNETLDYLCFYKKTFQVCLLCTSLRMPCLAINTMLILCLMTIRTTDCSDILSNGMSIRNADDTNNTGVLQNQVLSQFMHMILNKINHKLTNAGAS